jgi:hypothetical protein
VEATHAESEKAFQMFTKESVTKRDLEALVKKASIGASLPGSTQVRSALPFHSCACKTCLSVQTHQHFLSIYRFITSSDGCKPHE